MNNIEKEKQIVGKMIALYCRKHHRPSNSESLCRECRELMEYAHRRLSRCPQGEGKPTCRRCTIHCYSPERRRHIAAVMRFSGPRMLLYHPLLALRHLLNL